MAENSKGKTSRVLLLLARIALAVIFLAAAYAKLKPQTSGPWSAASVKTSLSMFAMQVDSYQLLPETQVSLMAHFLPPFELILGLWLLSGIGLRYSSLLTTLLLAGFFAVMVRTFALGLEINCGCFGPGEKLGPRTLLRDGSLLAVSLFVTAGAFLSSRRQSAASEPAPAISAPQRAD